MTLSFEAGMLPDDVEQVPVFAANVALFLDMFPLAGHQFRQMVFYLLDAFFPGQQGDERPSAQFCQRITRDGCPIRVDHQNFIISILGQNDGLGGFQYVRDEISLLGNFVHSLGKISCLLCHLGVQGFELERQRDRRIV